MSLKTIHGNEIIVKIFEFTCLKIDHHFSGLLFLACVLIPTNMLFVYSHCKTRRVNLVQKSFSQMLGNFYYSPCKNI